MLKAEEFDWRKAILQAIGIVLGFSLGFLGNWSLADGQWELIHLPALICLVSGNAILIATLYRLTMPKYRRRLKEVDREAHLFTLGATLTLSGFFLAIVAAWIRGY